MAVSNFPSINVPNPDALVLIHVDSPAPEECFAHGTVVNGLGWVISEQEITEIAVYLDDEVVSYASYGIPRPEVAERFPHFVQAEASGFKFNFRVGMNIQSQSPVWLSIHVTTASGAVHKKGLPLTVAEPGELESMRLDSRRVLTRETIRISIEQARVDSGGLIRISGWVLSVAPLTALELFLGSSTLGAPELGIARPDVAIAHPDYPNAATAGFRLIQDVTQSTSERPVLRARATSLGGITRQAIVPVEFPERQTRVLDSEASIQLCVDRASARSDGTVLVEGWAVSGAGVQEINVQFDGLAIGAADLGRARPDVGNRFPRISSARQSGFHFNRNLDQELSAEHLISLHIKNGEGDEKVLQLPVMVEEVDRANVSSGQLGAFGEIQYDVDAPALDGDRAREPVRGALTISGWAISSDGIDKIDVYLEESLLGRAYYGMRRPDIASAFPDVSSALLSGYAITVPYRLLGTGERTVKIDISTTGGKTVERSFSIVISKSEENISTTQLRRRIRNSELQPYHERMQSTRHRIFLVIVRSEGNGLEARDRLNQTLLSLKGQAFHSWWGIVIPAASESFAELSTFVKCSRYRVHGTQRLRVYSSRTSVILNCLRDSTNGHYVGVIRAGDLLGADAFLRVVQAARQAAGADFIYSDERRKDPANDASGAFFKPDWSPELLMSTNYIGRSWFASLVLADRANISLGDVVASSDYDLVLRLTEAARAIRHIPRVLIDTENANGDPKALERAALEATLQRGGIEGEVGPGRVPATWYVKRRLMTQAKVSFIIPTCGARGLIRTCIETIRSKTRYSNYELVVLDNVPDTLIEEQLWVRENSDKVLRITEKFNWSRFNNLGVAQAEGDFLLFLNDDIEILDGDWLEILLEQAERPGIGVVGPQLIYPDRKVQHAGMFLSGSHGRHAFRFADVNDPGYFGLALTARNMISVTGACMLSRRECYESIGGFDESHSVVNNDLDYCLRMWRNGQRVVYTPFTTLIHHELASRAEILDVYDEKRFLGQWRGLFLKGDPFHNPNMATDVEQYAPEAEPAEIVRMGHELLDFSRVESILAIKLDHIGDFITAFPAFRRLKTRFPKAKLTVLASKASKILATLEPAIDEVIIFDFYHARSALGRRDLTREEMDELNNLLGQRDFDLALDLRMQGDTRHLLQYSGAGVLAGFDHAGRFPWLHIALEWEGDTAFSPKRSSVVDRLCQLVESVAIAFDVDGTYLQDMSRSEAWNTLFENPTITDLPPGFLHKPIVCVHPAAGNETKQWPESYFADLIDLLTTEHALHVVLIGGKDELPIAERVLGHVQNRSAVTSLLGALSLKELPLLIRVAVLFVGNDSGPKHLAAAIGTPTVGIHSGIVDTAEWGPFGRNAVAVRRKTICTPCYVATANDCHRNMDCLRKLRPGDVYEACREMLAVGLDEIDQTSAEV